MDPAVAHRIGLILCLVVFIFVPWASLPLALVLVLFNVIRNNKEAKSEKSLHRKPAKGSIRRNKNDVPAILDQEIPQSMLRDDDSGGYFDTVEQKSDTSEGYFPDVPGSTIGMHYQEILESEQLSQNYNKQTLLMSQVMLSNPAIPNQLQIGIFPEQGVPVPVTMNSVQMLPSQVLPIVNVSPFHKQNTEQNSGIPTVF